MMEKMKTKYPFFKTIKLAGNSSASLSNQQNKHDLETTDTKHILTYNNYEPV